MNDTKTEVDPLLVAAETAWLEYARGTYSETDKRIFVAGFRAGSYYRKHPNRKRQFMRYLRREMKEAADGRN